MNAWSFTGANAGLLGTAAMATSALLSMANEPTKELWSDWFHHITAELDAVHTVSDKDYDEWLAIPNEPDLLVAPPHDEDAPEEFVPTETAEFNPFAADPGRVF